MNRVLDILEQKGLLIQDQRQRNAGANAGPAEDEKSLYPHMVIQELVTTERDYVQHIEMLQQFQNECQASGAIAGDAIHDMFLNLNAVMDFQRRFLIRIEQQNSLPWVDQNWGRLFAHYRESFRVYEPYIANQNRCTDTVSREWSKLKNAVFSPELQGMVETPAVLHSFLVKPLQRLSKYPMLLRVRVLVTSQKVKFDVDLYLGSKEERRKAVQRRDPP